MFWKLLYFFQAYSSSLTFLGCLPIIYNMQGAMINEKVLYRSEWSIKLMRRLGKSCRIWVDEDCVCGNGGRAPWTLRTGGLGVGHCKQKPAGEVKLGHPQLFKFSSLTFLQLPYGVKIIHRSAHLSNSLELHQLHPFYLPLRPFHCTPASKDKP